LIISFRDDVEIGVSEEEANDGFVNVGSLRLRFLGKILVNLFWRVSRLDQLLSQPLGISLSLVSLKDNVTFGIDKLGEINSFYIMPPFEEEMLKSILGSVHESSLQESFFKVFVLTSVFQGVKSTLDSSLEEPIQDLSNTSGAVGSRLRFSLSNGLSCVMPMLEGL
jgi:hypothetical protein